MNAKEYAENVIVEGPPRVEHTNLMNVDRQGAWAATLPGLDKARTCQNLRAWLAAHLEAYAAQAHPATAPQPARTLMDVERDFDKLDREQYLVTFARKVALAEEYNRLIGGAK